MSIQSVAGKAMLTLSKHSPEILVVSGVIGVVVAGVMACKATLKVDEIIDEHKENMDKIREVGAEDRDDYTQEDVKKDTTIQYVHTAGKLLKLYGPALLIAILSIVAIFASNGILRKRCVATAAAYTAVNNAFKAYRQRVIEKYGEEEDQKLYFGTDTVEITEVDEKGKTKKIKKEVAEVNDYIKYFTKTNNNWNDDPNLVQYFFDMQTAYFNKILMTRGNLTLNEVYRGLGLQETDDGMVVGWIFDRNNPEGDNCVHIYNREVEIPNEDGVYEKAYALDFNVDGLIYNKLNK